MAFIILYPAVACLALFIVGVIIIMLRFGPQLCGLRHDLNREDPNWRRVSAYEQEISYA